MFSNADIVGLCKDAALAPVREVLGYIQTAQQSSIRPVNVNDFEQSLKMVRPATNKQTLKSFEKWNAEFGSS